MCVVIIVQK